MINASDPLDYLPSGRFISIKHPVFYKTNIVDKSDSEKLSNVYLESRFNKEYWVLRDDKNVEEEELYYIGKLAVLSKGNQVMSTVQTSYCCETDISHAIWCTFYVENKNHLKYNVSNSQKSSQKSVNCICLFDSYTLKVFTDWGESYMTSLQFKVSSVWPTKYGVLLQKSDISPLSFYGISSLDNLKNISTSEETSTPLIYSLTHPLDDIAPVILKHGSISYILDASQQIIYTNIEPSFAFIFNKKTKLHSIYKIRKSSLEECQNINCSISNSSLIYNSIFSTSCNNQIGNSGQGIKNNTNKTYYSNIGMSSSPFRSRTTSYATSGSVNISLSSQHVSRSHSSMATISRCQSPTNPIFSMSNCSSVDYYAYQNKSHQMMLAMSTGQSSRYPGCHSRHSKNFSSYSFAEMITPELCLEHVWTENVGLLKDNISYCASRTFLTTDIIGQMYFCYLIKNQCRLHLVRLEKSNDPTQIILGMVTTISAIDAIDLPELNMIAIIDTSGNMTVYSGTSFIGKLHIPSNTPNVVGNRYTASNFCVQELSPYPRRSSLISPNKSLITDIKFDEAVHLLSPVSGNFIHGNLPENSSNDGNYLHLKNAVFNKLIFERGSLNYLKISLPTIKASPLVSTCLTTLRNILPRELAMQLLIKWYVARNAPGPQDLTINQEWNLFLIIFFNLFGYDINKLCIGLSSDYNYSSEHYSPIIVSKKQKTTNRGSDDDWSYLISSDVTHHIKIFLFDAIGLCKWKQLNANNIISIAECDVMESNKINIQSSFATQLPYVLFSLHLLYEELKLNSNMSENLFLLAKLLHQLSMDLNLQFYTEHYSADFPILLKNKTEFVIKDFENHKSSIPNFLLINTPNILKTLHNLLTNSNITSFPYLFQINPLSKNLIQLLALLNEQTRVNLLELDNYFKIIGNINYRNKFNNKSNKEIIEEMIMLCYKSGITKQELENLPAGISYFFNNLLYQCREKPPSHWPSLVYELIDRQDLAVLEKKISDFYYFDNVCYEQLKKNYNFNIAERNDGMEFDYTVFRLRFNIDHRVREVRKLLDSSEPVKISIIQRPDVSDHEFIEEQEKFLYALCTRTMALPIGRGMFTMRTSMPVNTEQLPIPRLCLAGKAPPRGTTIELTHIDIPTNMNLWPLFHNGVATGLCIHPSALNVDSTWIVYNKQQQGEFGIEHAGFLMALGLNGHLKNLAPFSMYEYLVECHETTSVGLLLGLSATHRSSMDVSMTKLLSLHVETLLPPTSIELNVQQNVQVAALMGVGLVYQGTNHRHIAHALLSEIGRPPGPEMKNCVDRESYSLTAGLALGLVVLCSGGGTDLANIPDTLHYYMVGGNSRPFCGSQKDKYKSPSYQIREGDSINIDVTSPGATIALGLMYLKSGNHAVAEWMAAPNTQYLLDFVRPDLLLLRILAKSLILWDDIEPSKTWISSHVPEIVAKYKLQKPTNNISEPIDLETLNQAYCNIIAGACMAVGLKYAGTENVIAFGTLYHFLKMFLTLTHKSIAELAGKATIETCLNVVLLSAAVVMAGTGNLEILRVCRHIRSRVGATNSVVTYGSHVATHMALGFLFLGGGSYTLSNNPASVAALLISLFPKFPTHSNDNRYHLQALRHFYVLATEPRLLLPKDIDNKKYCYAKIRLTFLSNTHKEGQKIIIKAPCLLPQLDRLSKIELDDDRYWKITFDKKRNFDQLQRILNANCILYVKQKAGCLSHMEDPQGFRTLLAQTLTTEDVIVWTASVKQITSFTTNTTVLNFVNRFVRTGDVNNSIKCDNYCINNMHNRLSSLCFPVIKNSTYGKSDNLVQVYEIPQEISVKENNYIQILTTMTYECVIRDKINFLPLWINIYKMLRTIDKQPGTNLIWQTKFLYLLKLYNNYFQKLEKLLNMENILANKQCIHSIIDKWETELPYIMGNVFTFENDKIDIKTFEKFVSYTIFYEMPVQLNGLVLKSSESRVYNKTTCSKVFGSFKFNQLFRN